MFSGLFKDLTFSLRLLRKSPVMSAAVVLSLALAVGANTAIFTLVDNIFLKPLPVDHPETLISLYSFDKGTSAFKSTSYPDYLDYSHDNSSLSGLAAYVRLPLNVSDSGNLPERIPAEIVTPNYFSVLGVRTRLGRTFNSEDESSHTDGSLAVISHSLWQTRYGSDPGVIGQSITLNRQPFTVIGVLPEEFKGTVLDWTASPEVWVTVGALRRIESPLQTLLTNRTARSFLVVGRLKPEISIQQAQSEVQAISGALAKQYPAENKSFGVQLLSAQQANFWPASREQVSFTLKVFSAVVILILLLACANIANLLFERALARRKEIALRAALGASRRRIIRQLLTESLLLGFMSAGCAVLVGYGMGKILLTFPRPFGVPLSIDAIPDARTWAFTFILCALSAFVFGTLPALQATGADPVTALKGPGGGTNGPASFIDLLRQALVVLQVTIACVLLVGCGLFARSLIQNYTSSAGFRSQDLTLMSIDLMTQGYEDGQGQHFYKTLMERLRSTPDVQSVSYSNLPPISPWQTTVKVAPEGSEGSETIGKVVEYNIVGEGYFRTAGIPLLAGRDFSEGDRKDTPAVAIINQTLAAQAFPHENPVGRRLIFPDDKKGPTRVEVVGVAKDAKYHSIWEDPQPYLYRPLSQDYVGGMTVLVRSPLPGSSVLTLVSQQVHSIDPKLPLYDMMSGKDLLDLSLSKLRLGAAVLGLFTLLALVLAGAGIYSVVAYRVTQRTREIGIRMALGGTPGRIILQQLTHALRPVLVGIGAGIILGHFAVAYIFDQVPGAVALDLMTYLMMLGIILFVALTAIYLPSRRASLVDPLRAIKYE